MYIVLINAENDTYYVFNNKIFIITIFTYDLTSLYNVSCIDLSAKGVFKK